MPYEFVDELTVADIAFRAWGDDLEETFVAAADAVMNAMVENIEVIQPHVMRFLNVEDEALEMLLFNFLLRIQELHIVHDQQPYNLQATVVGEPIDPDRHHMRVDVKAVTLHHFSLTQTERGWEAIVVLDI